MRLTLIYYFFINKLDFIINFKENIIKMFKNTKAFKMELLTLKIKYENP